MNFKKRMNEWKVACGEDLNWLNIKQRGERKAPKANWTVFSLKEVRLP